MLKATIFPLFQYILISNRTLCFFTDEKIPFRSGGKCFTKQSRNSTWMTGGKLQKSTKTRSERSEQWIRFTHEALQDSGVGKGAFPPTSGAGGGAII